MMLAQLSSRLIKTLEKEENTVARFVTRIYYSIRLFLLQVKIFVYCKRNRYPIAKTFLWIPTKDLTYMGLDKEGRKCIEAMSERDVFKYVKEYKFISKQVEEVKHKKLLLEKLLDYVLHLHSAGTFYEHQVFRLCNLSQKLCDLVVGF